MFIYMYNLIILKVIIAQKFISPTIYLVTVQHYYNQALAFT